MLPSVINSFRRLSTFSAFAIKLFPQASLECEGKRFDFAIIDELDNLTIDTAANSARLSCPANVTYEWVYGPIFEFVKKNYLKIQLFF